MGGICVFLGPYLTFLLYLDFTHGISDKSDPENGGMLLIPGLLLVGLSMFVIY